MTEPEGAREALIDFLKTRALPLPQVVTTPPARDNAAEGTLIPSFAEGSLLLKDKEGKFFRLVWTESKDAKANDRRRALPPGSYHLVGFHVARRDAQGKEWFVSMNLRAGTPLAVKAGETLPVKVDDTVCVACRSNVTAAGVEIAVQITGPHHAGVTLYKEGQRIPLRYRVTGREGQVLATGALEYG